MIHKSIIACLVVATLACAALWPMSHKTPNPCFLLRYTDSAEILFLCHGGTLRISHWRESTVSAPTKSVEKSFLGFGFAVSIRDTPQGRSSRMHRFILPMWFTAMVLVAYPIVALVRAIRRRRRRRHGYCRKCGYNLTGLSEPRCPECGTPFGDEQVPSLRDDRGHQVHTNSDARIP